MNKLLPTSTAGSLPKPSWLAEPEKLWSPWKLEGEALRDGKRMELLGNQAPGAGGEIQLTDSMETLLKTRPFHAYKFEGVTYDTGSPQGYLEAFAAMALKADHTASEAVLSGLLKGDRRV